MKQFSKIFYEADTGLSGGESTATEATETKPEKLFTQAEVNAFIAKQKVDKDTLAQRAEEIAQKKLEAFKQAEKLKGMSDTERIQEELKQAREEAELLKQEKSNYEKERLVLQYEKELTTKGLPSDLAKLIPINDADNAKLALDGLAKFKAETEAPYLEKIKALEEQLKNASLRGTPPSAVGNTTQNKKEIPSVF